jgi:hypothetical protein
MTWRPIETYEGRNDVLATDGDTVWVAWRDDDGQWFDATMGDRNGGEIEPIAWQPMPDPPAKGGELAGPRPLVGEHPAFAGLVGSAHQRLQAPGRRLTEGQRVTFQVPGGREIGGTIDRSGNAVLDHPLTASEAIVVVAGTFRLEPRI